MSKQAPLKYFASLSIEEQLPSPRHHQQQTWLLTYVDVFILIIMLVITLIALSDFKSEMEKQSKKTTASEKIQKKIEKVTPVAQKNTSPVKANIKHVAETPTPPPAPIEIQAKKIIKQIQDKQPDPAIQEKQAVITEQPAEVVKKEPASPVKTDENKLQQDFKNSLTELGLIDSVNMTVILGYAQLEIQDKILFKSSEAVLLNAGESLLKKLSTLLKQSTGLIYIEGHTDNRPIKTAKFPSNWELGAARATSVLHYLSSQNLDASRLRAITYGSTKPIADNTTRQGREKNRRVSLIIKVSDKID